MSPAYRNVVADVIAVGRSLVKCHGENNVGARTRSVCFRPVGFREKRLIVSDMIVFHPLSSEILYLSAHVLIPVCF